MEREDGEIIIDLREVWAAVRSRLVLIISAGIIFALLAMIFSRLVLTPQYESTTKMYVLNKQDGSVLTSGDMQTSTLLTKDYAELIKSRNVTEAVIAQLELGIRHEDLIDKMTVSTPTDTRIVSISIKDSDPYMAAQIADTIRDVAAEHIREVMDIEAVNVAQYANIPSDPISPNVKLNGVICGFLGAVISLAGVLISFLSNDTIQTTEDFEKYLGMSALGSIPLRSDEKKSKRVRKKRSSGSSKNKR